MRTTHFIVLAAGVALIQGCASVRQGFPLPEGLNCPHQTPAMLIAGQNRLGPLSDSDTLFCALEVIRGGRDPELSRSSLGSRLCLLLAEREMNQEKRELIAADGVDFAETALELGAENDGAVHYYLAENLGLALRYHFAAALQNLGRLESEMKKAVELDRSLDAGGPLRILGALYLKAPSWPKGIGDPDKALVLLEQAVKEHPEHPLNHLLYAQALWEDGGEIAQQQAKVEFRLGEKILAEGDWGYGKSFWQKEFDDFRPELGESVIIR